MDAATIEETNRIRVSLGMKPLPVPGADNTADSDSEDEAERASTLERRQAQGYENYRQLQEAEAAKQKREEKAAAIRKARDQAQRFAKLEGGGLGDDDKGDVDANSWLLGQKKRQKKIDKVRKLEAELAAAEAEAAAAVQYTSKDLAGIKVAHDSSAFLDGDEQILTLKDSIIGQDDEEGDELENFDLREKEKLSDKLDLKKRKPGYNPLDDDEDAPKGILSHYDEEIEGKKSKNFTLDQDGAIGELSAIMEQPEQRGQNRQAVNLDDIVGDDAGPSADYLAASEIKVKKPKKKKSKGTRQRQVDEDDIFPTETLNATTDSMDIDSKDAGPRKKRNTTDDDLVDDDDLQASLAAQRRAALKKRKKMRPEDLAKQLKEDAAAEEPTQEAEDAGLVIGEISEFVAGLSKPEEDEEERKPRRKKTTTRSPEAEEDHEMAEANDTYNPTQEEADLLHAAQRQEEEDNQVEEEKTVGQGMGAALALLRERGLVKDADADLYQAHKDREDFLAKRRLLQAELDDETRRARERDRASGKLDRMSQREREEYARRENERRDFLQSRRMAELFNQGYKPRVNIKYRDDDGRELNTKEAFKEMSHQFHGKTSGKGKTEKSMKKREDEKRREAKSLFNPDEGAGMSAAAQQQVKKRKEAGVRLL